MDPFLLLPNLDHTVIIDRTPSQCIALTSFEPREGDIILNNLRPLSELYLNISTTKVNGKNLLKITNWGQITVTLVEISHTPCHPPVLVLTEIRPRGSIDLLPYIDFANRFFTFVAYSTLHNDLKIVKLGINVTTDDTKLFLEYKII